MGRTNPKPIDHAVFDSPLWEDAGVGHLKQMARAQLGTVGSGNHYVDLFEDEAGYVWIGVHFGSRGLGHKSATHYLKLAGGKDGIDVAPTVVSVESELGQRYLAALVDRADEVPSSADAGAVLALRDEYRRTYFQTLTPGTSTGEPLKGNWVQLVGAAYDRTIVSFALKTTDVQDDELIRKLNARENTPRFNLLFRNCADFARDVVNLYFPKALGRNVIADLGFTTPKQISKSFVKYGSRRPDLQLESFIIPQIPGSRRESRDARGVLESLVKTKKYAIPLAVLQPWIPTGLAAGYLVTGRFRPQGHAERVYEPAVLERLALLDVQAD
jgi:hypothetical protein